MYKKIYEQGRGENKHLIHLWTDEGYEKMGNLDGFLIGQATFGNPWIFLGDNAPSSFSEKLPVMLKHAEFLIENKGQLVGCREIRKHLLSYIKGFDGAKTFRSRLSKVESIDEIYAILSTIESELLSLDNQSQRLVQVS